MPRKYICPLLAVVLCWLSPAQADLKEAGEVGVILLPASALAATLLYEEGNEGAMQLLKSYVVSELVTETLKTVIDKERPTGSCCTAFPSGHASKAFTAAHFIQRRYGWRYGTAAYGAAAFVAYSRVESDRHDEADVIAGALIGIASSHLFTTRYKDLQVSPLAQDGYVGLSISGRF
ncbi:MAG: phosphatase PAP2 family protein [Pseudomonadota bacterium]